VPVLYSETGFTSSETMWPGMNEFRQGPLVRNALWESLACGAIGTHIFAWHDRPYITDREKGFGILYANRVVKPAFWVSRNAFNLMKQVRINELLGGSQDPRPDIAFLWTAANDSQYNRYECEMQQIAGALERLGYEPNFMNLDDLAAGAHTNFKAIILPRNMRVDREVPGTGKGVLEYLRTVVIPAGVHVLASADLPGLQDPNGRPMTNFLDQVSALFGVNATDIGGFEAPMRRREYVSWYWSPITIRFTTNALGPLTNGYAYRPYVWKYSDEIGVTNGGALWAEMDSGRNKGFEKSGWNSTNLPEWDGVWGNWVVITNWGWQLDGTNMIGMWGDSGFWQDVAVVPGGRYTHSAYLRSNRDDPLHGGAWAGVSIEWLDANGQPISTNESPRLMGATTNDAWVRYGVDAVAPTNVWTMRKLIRCGSVACGPNLLANGGLAGTGAAPDGWLGWNTQDSDPDAGTYHDASPAWAFWWDCGIYQDVTNGWKPGDTFQFGGWLLTPAWDPFKNGDKYGVIQLEFYSNTTWLTTFSAAPTVSSNSASNVWIYSTGSATAPVSATTARIVVRINNYSGSGRFLADDIFLHDTTPGGAVYVDHRQWSPAVVVKDHGPAKAAIFLYSAGDIRPDGDDDGDPDTMAWQWRYDIFGAIFTNYFKAEPQLQIRGTNAYLTLAEYRTCTNGDLLLQVKNYLYQTNQPNGGANMTFTIAGNIFTGRTIIASETPAIIETNCDGVFSVSLPPDGQEILLARRMTNRAPIIQLADAPAAIHPFGDQCYAITVKYDTAGLTGLVVKVAFMEDGDNGDGVPNEIYQYLHTNTTVGAGEYTFWMWIPDPNLNDSDYISTPDGGRYKFVTWLEDAASNRYAESVSQAADLNWGIAPVGAVPQSLVKGATTNLTVKWEDLTEQLFWQNTPLDRNQSFPCRVAIFRSTKTERLYSNNFARCNAVADWLESLGYTSGNAMDLSFDNITVARNDATNGAGTFIALACDAESGTNGWTATGLWHIAGDLAASPARAWAYNNGVNYHTGARNTGTLTSPAFALTNAATVALTFKSWYETEDTGTAWDKKTVQVSTDGTNWTPLLQVSGANRQWTTQTADLGRYAGQTIWLRFAFDTVDGVYNAFRGWYVDDITVRVTSGTAAYLFADDMEATTNWTGDGLWRQTGARGGADVSGTNRWVYNRDAVHTNYNTGGRTSGALISRWIDLTGATRATLSFKSWYRTEDTGTAWDRKLVYVTTDGAAWTKLMQISGVDQRWTAQSYDLSAYAGQTIRIKFVFDSIDPLANDYEGWYVDDVAIATIAGGAAPVFSDTAESGTNEWNATGLWHQAADQYFSATHSWAYNNGANYHTGGRTTGSLISRWIDLAGAESAELTFKSWYETEDEGTAWDRKLVYVTADGTNWTPILQVSGASRQWTGQSCDLSAWAGRRIRVKFLFDSMDGLYNHYRGWYLDNIAVSLTGSGIFFVESFAADSTNWARAAGAGNWAVTDGALRAWRIGNDDNILYAGDPGWSNYTVSADIRYNRQGPYFNDAELYARYQDRDNFVRVGIRNFYGFWRLKYTVRVATNYIAQGWLHEFSKTNSPGENTWYNLRIVADGPTYSVFFDGQPAGTFTATNYPFAAGRIAVGTRASQLGIWEPQKGYFFVDDDEYAFYSPNEGEIVTRGTPLDLDWGYLNRFFPMLILPGTYVMSDREIANVSIWLTNGFYSLMATDGGVGMQDETGAADPGRIEALFGATAAVAPLTGLTQVAIGTNEHYATLDYAAEDTVAVTGAARAWGVRPGAQALGTLHNTNATAAALICNVVTAKVDSPPKVFCFNYGVDLGGQLTNGSRWLAQRAFEWVQGQTYKMRLELKGVVNPANPNTDLLIFATNFWTLNAWGTNALAVKVPKDNVMTGTNLYWVMYTFPWNATNAWLTHKGFFSSGNEQYYVTLPGLGLQVMGITDTAYAGRDWDLYVAYNTEGTNLVVHFGIQDQGALENEDNFNDGNYTGWTVAAHSNIAWSVTNGALRASVVGSNYGYAAITRDGLSLTGQNLTVEFLARWLAGATNAADGGLYYRGQALSLSPKAAGWRDAVTNLYTSNVPAVGGWNLVTLHVRDGNPYPRSDLLVNNRAVFLDEPIEATNWANHTVGFLSPYTGGAIEWDSFRVADEQYSLTTQAVSGVCIPTNANFWPSLPDYDPAALEFGSGSAQGAKYRWYIYYRGEDMHGAQAGRVYFAPRLMVENEFFPVNFNMGQTVSVPVEWENLNASNVPCRLALALQNPYTAMTYATNYFTITNASGSRWCAFAVPTNMPYSRDYQWTAWMFPTNCADPWRERIGADDTFRFDPFGTPVEPETVIEIHDGSTNEVPLFGDAGLGEGLAAYTWGGNHDGNYTGIVPPEGEKCWRDWLGGLDYTGWGLFATNPFDLTAYNYLRFWVKTEEALKIQIEAPAGSQKTIYLGSTSWDRARPGQWQQVTIPRTNFTSGVVTSAYGLFLPTLDIPDRYALSFVDANTGWIVGDAPLYCGNLKKTTNGGETWAIQSFGAAYDSWSCYGVDFADDQTGWACGYNALLKTTNGGAAWNPVTNGAPASTWWYSLDFINSQTGWACGYDKVIKTVNGGATWSAQSVSNYQSYYKIRFADANVGAVAGYRLLLTTTNGGANWAWRTPPYPSNYWYDVGFVNSATGWVCGGEGKVGRTADGGATWSLGTNLPAAVTGVHFSAMWWVDEQFGVLAGNGGRIVATRDGGSTWTNWSGASDCGFNGIQMLDTNRGFAVGTRGYAWCTTNGPTGWTDVIPRAREFYIDDVKWLKNL